MREIYKNKNINNGNPSKIFHFFKAVGVIVKQKTLSFFIRTTYPIEYKNRYKNKNKSVVVNSPIWYTFIRSQTKPRLSFS